MARSWFPEVSLNTWLKLISFLFLGLGFIVFSIFLLLSHKGFAYIFMGSLAIVSIYVDKYAKRDSKDLEESYCRKIINVMAIPIALFHLLAMLAMPFISVVIVAFFSVLSAVTPPCIIVSLLSMIDGVTFNKTTKIFIILVASSFIIVYSPSYIRSIIYRLPFVTYTEGKKYKKRMAELIKYVYDAGVVEFILNLTYVIFVGVICIKKYQNLGFLFSNEIDDVILNAFVVFLSFEGIRSSYKRIRLSAKSFFLKILMILDF